MTDSPDQDIFDIDISDFIFPDHYDDGEEFFYFTDPTGEDPSRNSS